MMRRDAAALLAEAWMTGDPLAPLDPAPAEAAEGDAIAAAVLDRLGLLACGVRLAPGPGGAPLSGPVIEGRLLGSGGALPAGGLRHATATAAIVGVLAEPLDPEVDGAPVCSGVHAAIDLAGSRWRDPPTDAVLIVADLGGLGHVVLGRRATLPMGPVTASLALGARRPRGAPIDLAAALAGAATAARRLGGLPAGAVLIAAGLSPPHTPTAGETLTARIAGVGRATIRLV